VRVPSPQVSSCSASDSDESEYDDDKVACPSTSSSEPAMFQCDEKPSPSSCSADHDGRTCTDDAAATDGKKKKVSARLPITPQFPAARGHLPELYCPGHSGLGSPAGGAAHGGGAGGQERGRMGHGNG
jgi:hypothetical protein